MATSASSPWPVAIPYENTTLPGYFYRAGDLGVPRPTVIMHTGFDGTAEEMHFQGQTVRAGAGDVPGLERRLRAGADPELDAQLARQMQASPVMRWAMEQAQWAFGVPTPRQACAAFLDYHLRDGIAEKIACPALICDAASGLFFAGQARQLFDHLTCPKTFLEFTADEGADANCQAGAERLALARICNWLDDTLGAPDQHTRTGDQNR